MINENVVRILVLSLFGSISLVYPAIEQIDSTKFIVAIILMVYVWSISILSTFAISGLPRLAVLICASILSFLTPYVALNLLDSNSSSVLTLSVFVWLLVTSALAYGYFSDGSESAK